MTKNIKNKCGECGEDFFSKRTSKFCSTRCRNQNYYKSKIDGLSPDDMLGCRVCGKFYKGNLISHIGAIHGLNKEEYLIEYPDGILYSKNYLAGCSERIKGKNNPAYKHGGKFSPFSKKFVKYEGKTEEEIIEHVSKMASDAQIKSRERGNLAVTKEYFIKRGHSQEEAKTLLSQRQTTFSLKKCVEKYGEKNGTEIWANRQKKWLGNFKRQNFSKISQNLFWEIYDKLEKTEDIYFAENKNGEISGDGVNNEYRLILNGRSIQPDFICLNKKRIIEFDGDYWHGKTGNKKREELRDAAIIDGGYQILHVKEIDYKKEPQKVISECVNFMKA